MCLHELNSHIRIQGLRASSQSRVFGIPPLHFQIRTNILLFQSYFLSYHSHVIILILLSGLSMVSSDHVLLRYDYCLLVERIGYDETMTAQTPSIYHPRLLQQIQPLAAQQAREQTAAAKGDYDPCADRFPWNWCPGQFTKASGLRDCLKYNPMDFHKKVKN